MALFIKLRIELFLLNYYYNIGYYIGLNAQILSMLQYGLNLELLTDPTIRFRTVKTNIAAN